MPLWCWASLVHATIFPEYVVASYFYHADYADMQMLSHVLFLQGQHWTNALWHAQMPLSQLTQALAIWQSSALSQHLNGLGYKMPSVTAGF